MTDEHPTNYYKRALVKIDIAFGLLLLVEVLFFLRHIGMLRY